ncbi:MAG TPA: hypothetical protein VFR24_01350 [Candidatus Angelobacter sp.]|nr:hypothetical protein [Candidatus Angelobacter sp.]
MKTAELAMGLVGTALQVFLCLLLLVRGAYRQFRFFSLGIVFSVAYTIALIAVHRHASLYLGVYWVNEGISVVLIFLALQESFYLVFRNFLTIPWFRRLFPGIGLLMLFVAVLRAAFHPAAQASLLARTLITLEISVGFLQFGIFCLFILLVQFFHLRWRQQAFGVVLGFGIYAAGFLVTYLLRSEFGTKLNPVVRITPPIAYIIAVVVWVVTFLRPEPLKPVLDAVFSPEQMASDFRRYTKALKGFLER